MVTNISRKIDRQKWVKFFTHLIVILMLFILPELIFNYARPPWKGTPYHTYSLYLRTAVYLSVFYINYFVIINYTLRRKKRRMWHFFAWNVLLVIVALIVLYYLQVWVAASLRPDPSMQPAPPAPHLAPEQLHRMQMLRLITFTTRDFVMLCLVIGLCVALRLSESWTKIEKHHEQLMASQKTEELESLKSQLNPHFLFNTLNTIYALIELSPLHAQEAVHELSTLLRYILYENPKTVLLSQEIDFVRSYISLMEMRLGPDTVKSTFTQGEYAKIEVAPLLFISIIENAFKHGNTGRKDQPIEISITADAEGTVVCRTRNHFVLKPDATGHAAKSGGIGISNLRRRLQLLYGNCASLSTQIEGDIYTTVLTIKTKDCQ